MADNDEDGEDEEDYEDYEARHPSYESSGATSDRATSEVGTRDSESDFNTSRESADSTTLQSLPGGSGEGSADPLSMAFV